MDSETKLRSSKVRKKTRTRHLYIGKSDEETWDKAEAYATSRSIALNSLVTEALSYYLSSREREIR
jgi:ABC-type sulfate transport system permease subunit